MCHKRANERLRQLHQSRAIDPDRRTVAPARRRSRAIEGAGTRWDTRCCQHSCMHVDSFSRVLHFQSFLCSIGSSRFVPNKPCTNPVSRMCVCFVCLYLVSDDAFPLFSWFLCLFANKHRTIASHKSAQPWTVRCGMVLQLNNLLRSWSAANENMFAGAGFCNLQIMSLEAT